MHFFGAKWLWDLVGQKTSDNNQSIFEKVYQQPYPSGKQMWIKIALRFYLIPIKLLLSRKQTAKDIEKDIDKNGTLIHY